VGKREEGPLGRRGGVMRARLAQRWGARLPSDPSSFPFGDCGKIAGPHNCSVPRAGAGVLAFEDAMWVGEAREATRMPVCPRQHAGGRGGGSHAPARSEVGESEVATPTPKGHNRPLQDMAVNNTIQLTEPSVVV
jgi:hypothetical protein